MKSVFIALSAVLLASCVHHHAPVVPVPRVPAVPVPVAPAVSAPAVPDPTKVVTDVAKKAPKVDPSGALKALEKLPALPLPGDLLK